MQLCSDIISVSTLIHHIQWKINKRLPAVGIGIVRAAFLFDLITSLRKQRIIFDYLFNFCRSHSLAFSKQQLFFQTTSVKVVIN
jgi:hypothetical protein